MTYPLLRVHLNVIEENMRRIIAKCAEHGMKPWGVTKGLSAPVELANALVDAGADVLADSRMMNIKRMKDAGVRAKVALIRIPMPSELDDVFEYVDYCAVSDLGTMKRLSDMCEVRGRPFKVFIMADMGDLREGFLPEEAGEICDALRNFSPLLKVAGIGVNFGCACGILPSRESLDRFVSFGETIEHALGYKLEFMSGGATTRSLLMMDQGLFPARVNNIRVGEGYLLGFDKSLNEKIPWLRQDTMELEAELVETRVKPTVPVGEVGRNSFGGMPPKFEDRGMRMRGILAVGRQDVVIERLAPLEHGISVITASSDHLIVDMEDCVPHPKVGDILRFRPNYAAMLLLSTSPYVDKVYER